MAAQLSTQEGPATVPKLKRQHAAKHLHLTAQKQCLAWLYKFFWRQQLALQVMICPRDSFT